MLNLLIRIACILSWTSVFIMPKKSIKRYLPVTILSALITVTTLLIGIHYRFWEGRNNPRKTMWNYLALVLGPFSVANLWIFHLTFGKFWLYFLSNLLNNLIYGFKIIPLIEKIHYFRYVKFTRTYHIIVTMTYALFLYRYQIYFERTFKLNRIKKRR